MIFLGKKEGGLSSLRSIAQKENISFDYLEKIFSRLEKKGLVKAKRGATGGYFLSEDPQEITLKDIFDAVEEHISVVGCIEDGCPRDGECMASTAWKRVNKKIEDTLSSVRLSELIK